ncbi:hypothetical protein [Sediminitomix flava]|uniref:Lipoprotein n=1 Tax=Sediminitomix flava TaxID=379075 RepID=A0A315ZGG7_SEDFL|nr:hypothetical protein [Sediminitomix flava]PWJ44685.1 hypothetical protein BC781_1011056 [Sediminitomix flava]
MKRLLILVSIIVLPIVLFSSCSKYSKKNSAYYNSQRAKYEVLDMHAGCPQLKKR